jgi:hypothetical protein
MSAFKPIGKKTLLAAGALAIATSALAAGPKDGIYIFTPPAGATDGPEFLTLHTNDAGSAVAGIYRSKAAFTPNDGMGLTTYAVEGGDFNFSLEPVSTGTVKAHMFRWSWWDSLSGTFAGNVATLEGTSNHVGCKAKVKVFLDGVQPTITMESTVSPDAQDKISEGMQHAVPGTTPIAIVLRAQARNRANAALAAECAKPTYNFTANMAKWF